MYVPTRFSKSCWFFFSRDIVDLPLSAIPRHFTETNGNTDNSHAQLRSFSVLCFCWVFANFGISVSPKSTITQAKSTNTKKRRFIYSIQISAQTSWNWAARGWSTVILLFRLDQSVAQKTLDFRGPKGHLFDRKWSKSTPMCYFRRRLQWSPLTSWTEGERRGRLTTYAVCRHLCHRYVLKNKKLADCRNKKSKKILRSISGICAIHSSTKTHCKMKHYVLPPPRSSGPRVQSSSMIFASVNRGRHILRFLHFLYFTK